MGQGRVIVRLASVAAIIAGVWYLYLYASTEETAAARSLGEAQITDLTGNMEPVTVRLEPEYGQLVVNVSSQITYPAERPKPEAAVFLSITLDAEVLFAEQLVLTPSTNVDVTNPLLEFTARASSPRIEVLQTGRYSVVLERVAGGDFPLTNATISIGTWPLPQPITRYLQLGIFLVFFGSVVYLAAQRFSRKAPANQNRTFKTGDDNKKRKWGRGE